MGEPAAARSLLPLEPPLLLDPLSPCEPLNPLLPKASLMLKCEECPKTLRFCSEAIHGQVPCGKENRNLVVIFHVLPSRMSPGTCPLAVPFSGQRWGVPGPGDPAAGQESGCALHEVWAAPAMSPVPFNLFNWTVASPCPRPSSCCHRHWICP